VIDRQIHQAVRILRREVPKWDTPVVTLMAETYESPFRVLISCILSLRTQDATTAKASHRLFAVAIRPKRWSNCRRGKSKNSSTRWASTKPRRGRFLKCAGPSSTATPAKSPMRSTTCLHSKASGAKRRTSSSPWATTSRHLRRHPCAPDLQPLGLYQNRYA